MRKLDVNPYTYDMATELEKLRQDLERKGIDPRKAKNLQYDALRWFAQQHKSKPKHRGAADFDRRTKTHTVDPDQFLKGKQGIKSEHPIIGQMFSYKYDAKWKAKLKYWDAFPLIFVINLYEDGFLGLNLHYLPLNLRMRLLIAIESTMNSDKKSREAKAKITYGMIKSLSQYRLAEPTIHRYLTNHVKSKIIRIAPTDWAKVAMLPTADWRKATQGQIWNDSRAKIAGTYGEKKTK